MEYYTSYSTVPTVVVLLIVGSFSIEMAAVHGYIDYNQPIRQTQPSTYSGREIITGQGAVFCGWESNHRSGINRLPVSDTVVYPLKPRPHQIAYFVLMVPLRIYSLTTPLPPRPHQQQCRSNVQRTIFNDKLVLRCCRFLATESNVAPTLLLVWTGGEGGSEWVDS